MSKVADDNFEFQKIVVVLGFTLLFIKYLAYWLTGSVAIFTDATESIVNVVAACIGIYALYLSAQPADKGHPFGHEKIEVIRFGKHLCSDTYSSVGILIGLVVVYVAQTMGYDARWLDSSIAAVFGVIILVTGIGVIKRSIDEIMDAADQPLLKEVTETVKEYRHDDWIDVYNLRLIKYGSKIFVDMKVVLPRRMTVEEQSLENNELVEAIQSKYGDSVEISVNPGKKKS